MGQREILTGQFTTALEQGRIGELYRLVGEYWRQHIETLDEPGEEITWMQNDIIAQLTRAMADDFEDSGGSTNSVSREDFHIVRRLEIGRDPNLLQFRFHQLQRHFARLSRSKLKEPMKQLRTVTEELLIFWRTYGSSTDWKQKLQLKKLARNTLGWLQADGFTDDTPGAAPLSREDRQLLQRLAAGNFEAALS